MATLVRELCINPSISAGAAMFAACGESFDVLFGRAEPALYPAKRSGQASYCLASVTLKDAAVARLRLKSA